MHDDAAIEALAALAHPGRLAVFRLLVKAGEEGLAAGEVARRMVTPANTMSTQLAILARTGLIRSRRKSRSIIYQADYDRFAALLGFLVEDCCSGQPQACAPLLSMVQSVSGCATDSPVQPA